jgi:hypothetical protein
MGPPTHRPISTDTSAHARERDEETVSGCVAILSEILRLLNPPASRSAARIRRYVLHVAARLELPDRWQLEIAALLCRLGCIVVPAEVLDKALAGDPLTAGETNLLASHPTLGAKLLATIPRLHEVAAIVGGQNVVASPPAPEEAPSRGDPVTWGSQVLRAAIELDRLAMLGHGRGMALAKMRKTGYVWPQVLAALEDVELDTQPGDRVRRIGVASLRPGMILEEDVRARNGLLLVARGQEVTLAIARRVQGFAQGLGVREPFSVRVPAPTAAAPGGRSLSPESG